MVKVTNYIATGNVIFRPVPKPDCLGCGRMAFNGVADRGLNTSGRHLFSFMS